MKKLKIIIMSIILLNFTIINADNNPEITNIKYSGELKSETVIDILGNNLSECSNAKVGSKEIKIQSKTQTKITLNFSDIEKYDSNIVMECGNFEVSKEFKFPHIENIILNENEEENRKIQIKGEGFKSVDLKVEVEGGTFKVESILPNVINGYLPEELKSTKLIVNVGGLKSNAYEIPFFIPNITHITSDKNFYVGSEIEIHGENLNEYGKYNVKIDNDYINDTQYSQNTKSIKLKLPNTTGDKEIRVYSNGISSNKVKITIKSERPIIENIEEKYENSSKKIYITGEKFGNSSNTTKVYVNGKQIQAAEYKDSSIIISSYNLIDGDNYFEVENNGKKSYTFTKKIDINDYPEISWVNTKEIKEGKRYLDVYLKNFNENTDNIYLDGSKVTVYSPTENNCTIIVAENKLLGELTIKRGDYQSPKSVKFDFSQDLLPYINYIELSSIIGDGVKVSVNGWNFSNGTTITSSNFFKMNRDNKPSVSISNSFINGEILENYDKNSNSTITIKNGYGLSTSITFKGSELGNSKIIYGTPIISSLTSDSKNGIFKKGSKVKVTGKVLNSGNNVQISDKETTLKEESGEYYFIIPEVSNLGKQNVIISNKSGHKSNSYEIIISPESNNGDIIISNKSIEKNDYYTESNKNLDKGIYSLSLSNSIDNFIIKNLSFIISGEDEDNTRNLGTFELMINDKSVGVSGVDENFKISFGDFKLDKSVSNINITLYKKSQFLDVGNFKVTFEPQNTKLELNNKDFKDIKYDENFIENSFKIYKTQENTCVDTQSSNINCNSIEGSKEDKIETQINKDNNENVSDNKIEEINNKEISLEKYEYKSKSLNNIQKKFEGLYNKLENDAKYQNNINDIKSIINEILSNLYYFENVENNNSKKAIFYKLKDNLGDLKLLLK